jgi:hypothetical protein
MGVLQMYSVQKEVSQNVRGRSGVFATITPQGWASSIEVPHHTRLVPSKEFIESRNPFL